MALVTRTITNAGAPLHSPDGDLLVGVKIHFQLMDAGGRASDAWDATTNERVGGETVVATTDAAGEFTADLWPNTRGNRATKYKCRVQFEGFREFSGIVEDVPGELQWVDFMLGGSSMEPQDISAIAAAMTSHLNAADPHTQYAKESDLGGAASLDVGTTAGTVAAGDDARLTDARPPTGGAGGVLSGNYPNPGFAVDMATQAELDTQMQLAYAALDDLDAAKVDKIAGKGLSEADFTTAEKTKLAGVAAGATANATDAQLRDRATHTGTQATSTIVGLDATLAAKASLVGGKVPESQLPAIAITDVFSVATQAAMLALTAERGDVAVRSDLNKSFALAAEPASTLANWIELRTPTDAVLSVAGKTGAVTLAKADVGLGNVDNTSDASKPVSTAQAAAFALKVDTATLSAVAAPNKTPIAGATGKLDQSWFSAIFPSIKFNDIGVPGAQGFGVGICPQVPAGFTPMAGATDPASANYGNYQHSDGSIMVWVPAYRFRLGNAADPGYATYGANTIRIVPVSAHPDEATANAEGFYLHAAFMNAGVAQPGFFRDKYDCSANGSVASSIALAIPMVSGPAAGQVGFSAVGAANAYYGAFAAARTRGAKFHPETVQQADAITRISEAHAQASTATTYCAWWSAGSTNYPKGCDNNALGSTDDGTLTFTSAGAASYPNMALTGSGSNFAKTTHNGQACGIADVAGNIYKINPGMTSIGTTKAISAATKTNPVQITVTGHGRITGDVAVIEGVVGMTQINTKAFTVTVVDANNLTLDGVDGTAFGTYTSGGTLYNATFYALKPTADITAITDGATLSTDHWGAAGVAANFDPITLNFRTDYPNNTLGQRYGNGSNAVFSNATAADRARTMLGMPAAGGVSPAGSSLTGLDYYYEHAVNQLCVISRGSWSAGSNAGGRCRHLYYARSNAHYNVGFAASCYL
ncbi:MAG: hypothetical protein ABS55_01730 [Lautropia sp. SCN 70-15]|nr:MAG: hypothetical protein ABS55_01730 [Lautropia sp. SCN 70-15]